MYATDVSKGYGYIPTNFVAKRFVKLLKSKGFRVIRRNHSQYSGNWDIRGHGMEGLIVPHYKEAYGADLFLDTEEYWDKCSKAIIRVDTGTVNIDDLLSDITFLNTDEGNIYNGQWGYLEDNWAKLKTHVLEDPKLLWTNNTVVVTTPDELNEIIKYDANSSKVGVEMFHKRLYKNKKLCINIPPSGEMYCSNYEDDRFEVFPFSEWKAIMADKIDKSLKETL